MTIYRRCEVILNDCETYSKKHHFPEIDDLIWRARQAMKKDLLKHLELPHRKRSTDLNALH